MRLINHFAHLCNKVQILIRVINQLFNTCIMKVTAVQTTALILYINKCITPFQYQGNYCIDFIRQFEASTCYLAYLPLLYIKLYPAHIEFPDNNFDESVLSHAFHPFRPLTVQQNNFTQTSFDRKSSDFKSSPKVTNMQCHVKDQIQPIS